MDTAGYLDKFQKSVNRLNLEKFHKKQMDLKVGTPLNSVAVKIQKKAWLSIGSKPFETSVFFSVWIGDE